MKHPKFNRIMSLLLALAILTGAIPLRLFPFELDAHASQSKQPEQTEKSTLETLPDDPSARPIVYDALWVAVDGEVETSISIQTHEKVAIQAIGLEEDADYQWQIRHPEKSDLWVDIYDGTSKDLSVTYALVGNMLTDKNTATLRCRAYTEDYAYLTHYFTVSVLGDQPIANDSVVSEESAGQETAASGAAETPEFVTVTIKYEKYEYQYDADAPGDDPADKYVLTYMGPAFSSYVATLKYNGSLNTTVANPTIMGYAPYLGNAEESTASVVINETNITEDIVITVNYKPAKVKYEVHYYFQNIYDDLYTEDATIGAPLKGEGITGLPPEEGVVQKEFNGFTSLYYQPDTIAADGSTLFEVYYERNYYLMEFDCDGGYGVHAIYVRHGTYVSVATPQKAGYVFDADGDGNGWDLVMTDESSTKVNCADGVADKMPSTMPTYNTSYKALWTTAMTKYTVVYWIDNGDETNTFYGSRPVEIMSASVVSGSGDLTAAMNVCGVEAHTHTDACGFSCGKVVHSHTAACCDITAHTHDEDTCYNYCTHVCTTACYTATNLTLGSSQTSYYARTAYNAIIEGEDYNPKDGYVYRYRRNNNNYYNFLCVEGILYYLGNNTYSGVTTNVTNPTNNGQYNSAVATQRSGHHTHEDECWSCTTLEHNHTSGCNTDSCPNGGVEHTHGASCYGCKQNEHTHTDDCKASLAPYLEYVEADTDKNVIVEGDGSTVVNVYYKKKIFEIRYVYSRSYVNNGNTVYQIANSTGAGALGTNWATTNVNGVPSVKDPETYPPKSEVIRQGGVDYTYYYIAVRAEFGANIEDIWPSDAIDNANANGTAYYFGSWGAEAGSPYRADDPEHANIVGPYPYMSAEMIHPDNYYDSITDPETGEIYYLAQRMSAWWGASHNNISPHTYHIYIESLTGTGERQYEGKWYNLVATHGFTAAHNGNTRVDPFYYNGFTCANDTREHGYNHQYDYQMNSVNYQKGSTARDEEGHLLYDCPDNSCAYCNCFYYDRVDNTLAFFNYNAFSDTFPSQIMQYQVPVSNGLPTSVTVSPYEPPYPEGIEPNAYVFEGWFTSPGCYPGTEVDWENLTMPDGDLTLYAKWTPVVRDVSFYLLYTDVEKGNYWQPEGETIEYPIKVPHGELLGTTYNHIPTRGEEYQFIGWFYFDENGKKKFAPDSMKVTRNLDLFAEWYSTVPTTYEVRYEAWSEKKGVYTLVDDEIAKITEGYSTAGKTTTFNAKGEKALYDKSSDGGENYQSQWFPEHSSHSILMDEDSTKNTHTFRYFHKEHINYKVMYIDRSTGAILGESEVKQTTNAIVTEKFLPFEDYLPENYYIEKAIAYDPTDYTIAGNANHVQPENIIYFYYNPDTTHDPFHIEHWYENLDGTYTLMYTENGIADNDAVIPATPRKTAGYEHIQSKAEVITYYKDATGKWQANAPVMGQLSGKVSEGGLDIKLYYDRKTVDYTIQYVCSNPYGELYTTTVSGEKFGATVTHMAPAVYEVAPQTYIYFDGIGSSDEQRTKSIVLRENAEDNVIIFYYNLKQITVLYHVVCTVPDLDSLNGVSMSMQLITAWDEGVESTAMPGTGFRFVGWYYDEECKNPVPSAWIDTDGVTIHPKETPEDDAGKVHFYALFEPLYGKITITKSFADGGGVATDSFLFRVKGKDYNNRHIDLTVSITGAGTVTIENVPIGNYEVTELTAWSYEYTASQAMLNGKVTEGSTSNFAFTNTYRPSNWLGGEASEDNRFSAS